MKYAKLVLIWLFTLSLAFVMIQQGWAKFSPDGRWTRSFAEWGYPVWFRQLIGVLETGGGLALLAPPIAFYGATVIAVVMVGAAGTLLLNGRAVDAITPVVYLAVLAWVAFERREKRLGRKGDAADQVGEAG